ncbi:ester cyclase [Ectothiorhodospiraceae bacterium WFHF3C12]|nr:ester cyclase [Ectothiorhodospiraceae bacterium WFHF3C12]
MSDTNKELVRAFVEAINASAWTDLRTIVSPGFVRHSYAAGEPGVRSLDDLIGFLESETTAFPDGKEDLLDLIAEDDKVAARHRFIGTQSGPLGPFPPSNRKMVADYIAIYRIEEGRIVEAWVEWDNKAGLAQLGHE